MPTSAIYCDTHIDSGPLTRLLSRLVRSSFSRSCIRYLSDYYCIRGKWRLQIYLEIRIAWSILERFATSKHLFLRPPPHRCEIDLREYHLWITKISHCPISSYRDNAVVIPAMAFVLRSRWTRSVSLPRQEEISPGGYIERFRYGEMMRSERGTKL